MQRLLLEASYVASLQQREVARTFERSGCVFIIEGVTDGF